MSNSQGCIKRNSHHFAKYLLTPNLLTPCPSLHALLFLSLVSPECDLELCHAGSTVMSLNVLCSTYLVLWAIHSLNSSSVPCVYLSRARCYAGMKESMANKTGPALAFMKPTPHTLSSTALTENIRSAFRTWFLAGGFCSTHYSRSVLITMTNVLTLSSLQ